MIQDLLYVGARHQLRTIGHMYPAHHGSHVVCNGVLA
jgi:hypothetical protein